MSKQYSHSGYGLDVETFRTFPLPMVTSLRAPTTTDTRFEPGQIWIYYTNTQGNATVFLFAGIQGVATSAPGTAMWIQIGSNIASSSTAEKAAMGIAEMPSLTSPNSGENSTQKNPQTQQSQLDPKKVESPDSPKGSGNLSSLKPENTLHNTTTPKTESGHNADTDLKDPETSTAQKTKDAPEKK